MKVLLKSLKRLLASLVTFTTISFPFFAFATGPTIIGTPVSSCASGSSTTISTTLTTSAGNNTMLVVFVSNTTGAPATSATWDVGGTNQAMTVGPTHTGQQISAMGSLYLAAPTVGSNLTLTVTYPSATRDRCIVAFEVQDAKQTSPIDGGNTYANWGVGAVTSAFDVTTATDNSLSVAYTAINDGATSITPINSTNIAATAISDLQSFSYTGEYAARGAAGTLSMGYTWTNSVSFEEMGFSILYQAPSAAASPPLNNVIMFGF